MSRPKPAAVLQPVANALRLGSAIMSITRVSSSCALAGVLLLLAGCGSSSSSSGGTTTSSSTSPTASPSPTHTAATLAQLKKIVLQTGDLPAVWKASPTESDSNQGENELTKCAGGKDTDPDRIATTDSEDYSLGDATISSSASSYKSQSDVDSDIALLKSPKLTACANQVFKKELSSSMPEGSTIGALSVKFTPGPGAGPANVAGVGSVTVPISASGQQAMVYVEFVFLTGPQLEAEVDAENVGAPVPAAVLQAAVKAVADRAANSG